MIFTYQYGEQTHSVQLEALPDGRYKARIGQAEYIVTASPSPDGGLMIDWGEGRALAHSASSADQRSVHIMGQTFALSVPESRTSRRRSAQGAGGLTAQMPGQVVQVLVAEGEAVSAGQPLVILEAMKMEIRVSAPADGRVKALLVSPGEVVERGQRLVELEASAGE